MDKIEDVFITIQNVGFCFDLDKNIRHNLISPALLEFFNVKDIEKADTNALNDRSSQVLPDIFSIRLEYPFRIVGKELGRCHDKMLRMCKIAKFDFVYEGCTFSFPFLIDNSLEKPALLSMDSFRKMARRVNRHNS